jgi:hypothetical protein
LGPPSNKRPRRSSIDQTNIINEPRRRSVEQRSTNIAVTEQQRSRRDDTESLPTPPPQQIPIPQRFHVQSSTISSTVSVPESNMRFKPKILGNDKSIFYNLPSSSQMRNASKILGLEFNKEGQVFWNSTLQWISEFRGSSKPTEYRDIQLKKISGFASLAIFVTGSENFAFEIQEAVKAYFFDNFVTGKSCNFEEKVVMETLITNDLTEIHLALFAEMINCLIGVFDGNSFKMFGSTEDEQASTMLLTKTAGIYAPVISIKF